MRRTAWKVRLIAVEGTTMIIRKSQMLLLTSAFVIATSLVGAQQPAATNPLQSVPLTQAIPVDEQVTRGQLQNGLHYYLRANAKPEKRAEVVVQPILQLASRDLLIDRYRLGERDRLERVRRGRLLRADQGCGDDER